MTYLPSHTQLTQTDSAQTCTGECLFISQSQADPASYMGGCGYYTWPDALTL